MDWRQIPSLAALRAFEACARHESLSAAAAELNVTHAAVSQHVRTLEGEFNCALIARRGRGIALTAEGAGLAQSLSEGFGAIGAGIAALRDRGAERPLTVSVTPAFAENWLMPRLGAFWAAHPDVPISLLPSRNLVDLRRDGVDVAIRFGDGNWPGLQVEPLTEAAFVVVGAPSLFDGKRSAPASAMRRTRWFFETGRNEFHIWAEANKMTDADTPTIDIETNQLVLSAVRQGYGLSAQVRALVERDLEAGTLATYCETHTEDLRYHIVTIGTGEARVRPFVKWLRTQS